MHALRCLSSWSDMFWISLLCSHLSLLSPSFQGCDITHFRGKECGYMLCFRKIYLDGVIFIKWINVAVILWFLVLISEGFLLIKKWFNIMEICQKQQRLIILTYGLSKGWTWISCNSDSLRLNKSSLEVVNCLASATSLLYLPLCTFSAFVKERPRLYDCLFVLRWISLSCTSSKLNIEKHIHSI